MASLAQVYIFICGSAYKGGNVSLPLCKETESFFYFFIFDIWFSFQSKKKNDFLRPVLDLLYSIRYKTSEESPPTLSLSVRWRSGGGRGRSSLLRRPKKPSSPSRTSKRGISAIFHPTGKTPRILVLLNLFPIFPSRGLRLGSWILVRFLLLFSYDIVFGFSVDVLVLIDMRIRWFFD